MTKTTFALAIWAAALLAGSTGAAAPARPTAPAPKAKAAPTPAPAPSGTLVSAVASFGEDTLDPLVAGAATTQALIYPMFELLVADDGKGNNAPILAAGWSLSPDGRVWTLKLRKGVKFHNGDDFTSADAKFSLERIISPKSRSAAATMLRPVIEEIEAPDPQTLVVRTKDVTVTFIDLLTGGGAVMMPKRYLEEKGEAHFREHPVGTGPWRFVRHEPGAAVELEAVRDHWRVTPAFEKLVIRLVPEESTRLALLKRREADVAELSLENVDELKASGLELRALGYDNVPALYLPATWLQTGQPTMDPRVRRALSLAIDRQELAKSFFKGYASPHARVKMTPGSYGWDPAWKPEPYDPKKARALLAEAGYPGKFSDPVVTLWSYPIQGANWMPQFIEIISGYWEAVGVKTKIAPVDFATMRAMYRARPVEPKIVGTVFPQNEAAQPNPLMSIINAFGTKGVAPLMQDAAWDKLYADVVRERDEKKRLALTRELMAHAHRQTVAIMTVSVKQVFGVSRQVGEWRRPLSGLGRTYESMQRR